MLTRLSVRSFGAVLSAAIWLSASAVSAQNASSDAAEKAKIMASPAWKQMAAEYQKWLNSQVIYTPDDIKRINANLAAQIQSMSAAEMQDFLNAWQAKLRVLNGQDFQDAQQWLGEYMSALSDGYRTKTLKALGLTDIANMSADQLEQAINQIRADRLAIERNQIAFNRAREQQVQMVQSANAAGQQAQQQALTQERAPQFSPARSPYRPPGPWNPPPAVQTQFYVNSYGQVGYLLPF